MMNLFAYGTLMWPEVMASVIGRRIEGVRATLNGYQRLRVKGEHYPVVVASEDDSVEGILYPNLTEEDFDQLDRFEGEEYVRITVCVDGTEAQVYVLSEEWWHIAEMEAWRPEEMRPEHLASFCAEYKGWREV